MGGERTGYKLHRVMLDITMQERTRLAVQGDILLTLSRMLFFWKAEASTAEY